MRQQKLERVGSKKRRMGASGLSRRDGKQRRLVRKGGGGLRAFISRAARLKPGRANFKELAGAHKAAREENSPLYHEAPSAGAAAAAIMKATGRSGFGGPSREVRRKRAALATQSAASSSSGLVERPALVQDVAESAGTLAVPHEANLSKKLSLV